MIIKDQSLTPVHSEETGFKRTMEQNTPATQRKQKIIMQRCILARKKGCVWALTGWSPMICLNTRVMMVMLHSIPMVRMVARKLDAIPKLLGGTLPITVVVLGDENRLNPTPIKANIPIITRMGVPAWTWEASPRLRVHKAMPQVARPAGETRSANLPKNGESVA